GKDAPPDGDVQVGARGDGHAAFAGVDVGARGLAAGWHGGLLSLLRPAVAEAGTGWSGGVDAQVQAVGPGGVPGPGHWGSSGCGALEGSARRTIPHQVAVRLWIAQAVTPRTASRYEEHTSELQSREKTGCCLLLQ